MPTNYQFQPFPLANEEEFDNFIMELFNELNPNHEYQTYGRRGERQNGIDIICYEQNTVIQCKKKELSHTTTSIKRLKTTIKTEFRADLEAAVKCKDFQFDKFIFATTFPSDTELQNLANTLSKEFNKDVKYFGWGIISHKLYECKKTLSKYYDFLTSESSRISDDNFKKTVKNKHIIDQCYQSLLRFDGFNFIDPHTIANAFPFKVSDERTYPLYHQFCLSTNNENLTTLFSLLEIVDNKFIIKQNLKSKVEKICPDANEKIKLIQETLHNCLIFCIKTTDGVHHKIPKSNHIECTCSACLTEDLRFFDLSTQLENESLSLSKVYGYYRLNDFSKAKDILNAYLKIEFNPTKLAIARYNEYWLSILSSNDRISKYEFYSKIRSIEFDNEPVQEAIIDLEQDRILSKSHQKIDNIISEIERIYYGYKRGNYSVTGSDYANQLTQETMILYSYYRNNFLIKDIYGEYKEFFRKALTGWLFSLNTDKKYQNKLKELDVFHVAMSVFSSSAKELFSIFKETNTTGLKMSDEACLFLERISLNFLNSSAKESPYKNYLKDLFGLSSTHRSLFQSILINLSYSSISKCPKDLFSSLLTFIEKENFLLPYDYNYIGLLFRMKGEWFSYEEHLMILNLHLGSTKLNSELITDLLGSYERNGYTRISDYELLLKLLKKDFNNYEAAEVIGNLRRVSDKSTLSKIDDELFTRLDSNFDSSLYRELLIREPDFLRNSDELFEKYIIDINKTKGTSLRKDEQGFEINGSYVFINFISSILMCKYKQLNDPLILKHLDNLSPYQLWLLNPEEFNYTTFNVDWIGFTNIPIVLNYVGGKSKDLRKIVHKELKSGNKKHLQGNFITILTSIDSE